MAGYIKFLGIIKNVDSDVVVRRQRFKRNASIAFAMHEIVFETIGAFRN